jgi:hypothetical protein
MRRIVFVSRRLVGESMRAARAINRLDKVQVLGIAETLPKGGNEAEVFAELVGLAAVDDAEALTAVARGLAQKHGRIDRIVTTTETLLEPVARASEALGLQGMSVATVRRALDKSCLKATLEGAGIHSARDQVLTNVEDASRFIAGVGFPIVLKPLGGSGALATLCIRNAEEFELALELMPATAETPLLAEEYLNGQELCIDTITIGNEPRFYSICCYNPSILEAVEDQRIQWTCVMPRDITGPRYRDFIDQGLTAARALSVGDAMTHMEGFLVEGRGPCFTDATLRPAGARIGPMLAFAYDINPYLAWARVALDGCFDGPWERKYAVGTVFLRGNGSGLVENVHGIESLSRRLGDLMAESRLPRVGAAKSGTYTGDGYITVRHPETEAVEDALRWIAETVRISYTHSDLAQPSSRAIRHQWAERLQGFNKQLNRPAWDDDTLPSLNNPPNRGIA